MANMKLLLTGATGYIGGSVLAQLLASTNSDVKNLSISVLVRKEEEAEYFKSIGVSAVLFKGLEQVDLLKKTASEHDVVVNTASAFQPQAAEALIQGLAERKKTSSAPVYFINTSGTSSIANRPVSKIYLDANEQIEFSDKDDIASYELQREALEQYGQRTTDLAVVATGVATGVPTYILMSPTIYGQGTGHFNKRSIQIPLLTRLAIAKGYAEYIGDGAGVWDHAHIDDTAALYELVLTKLLSGETLPSGKSGIYFAGAGRSSWKGVAEGIAKAGYKLGALKEQVARSVGLEAMAQDAGNFPVQFVELGFASRSVTNADLARELGWEPKKTEVDWEAGFLEDFKVALGDSSKA